jgi:hypothetical protein
MTEHFPYSDRSTVRKQCQKIRLWDNNPQEDNSKVRCSRKIWGQLQFHHIQVEKWEENLSTVKDSIR